MQAKGESADALSIIEAEAKQKAAEDKLESLIAECTALKEKNIEMEQQLRSLTAEPSRSSFAKRFMDMKKSIETQASGEAN